MLRSSLAARLTVVAAIVVVAAALTVPALAARSHAALLPKGVTVTATEFKFKLSRTSARHGRFIFKLVNRGKLGHDFKIGGHKTAVISPGKTERLRVTLAKGRYAYSCTVPGHASAGMKGTFVVT